MVWSVVEARHWRGGRRMIEQTIEADTLDEVPAVLEGVR
jgi:hypothetical protein